MGTLADINATVAQQNAAVKGQAAAPPTEAPKPEAQSAEEAKAAEQIAHQPTTVDKKADRKQRLKALEELAEEKKHAFVATQQAKAEREKSSAEAAQLRGEMQAMRDELARTRADLEEANANPLQWLQKRPNFKLRQLAEEVAKGDAPDFKVKQLESKLAELSEKSEARVAELEQQIERSKKEAAEKEAKAVQQAQYAKEKAEFLADVDRTKDKLPHLMKATGGNPNKVIREYMLSIQDLKEDPEIGPRLHEYSNEEILQYTDARLKEMGVVADAPKPAAEAPKPALTSADPKPTLTTAGSAEPAASAPLPPDFKKLTGKAEIKALSEIYKSKRKSA